jgi:hypothetical protein
MNYTRAALAFLGSTVAYFILGFILLTALPAMKAEYAKYPEVYRSEQSMMKAMPPNMVGILVSIAVVTFLYARMYPTGGGWIPGVVFGSLVGIFAVCTYAVHNYALLNIGSVLTFYESFTYFLQWLVVGGVIGLIYQTA